VARPIEWTESAWQELEGAASFIARDSRRNAAALIDEARACARSLKTFPLKGAFSGDERSMASAKDRRRMAE
jgi:plasmid stabilization system protein ParE